MNQAALKVALGTRSAVLWGTSRNELWEKGKTSGETFDLLDGTIVGKFGRAGKAPGEFATIHGIDCRDPNTLYTAEINNWRAQKIVLKPTPAKASN